MFAKIIKFLILRYPADFRSILNYWKQMSYAPFEVVHHIPIDFDPYEINFTG
jgi:hypothetical protein